MNSAPWIVSFVLVVILEFSSSDETNPYRHLERLDSEGRFVVEWEVNWELGEISFDVTAKTKGYIGFGLSTKGDLEGADVIVGGVYWNGLPYFSDLHGIDNWATEVDPSQDWQLHSSRENGTHTFLKFSRKLETCDENDFSIGNDVVTLIWALGESDYYHDNLWNHCDSCHGQYPVYLLDKYLTPRGIQDTRIIKNQEPGPDQFGDLKVWTVSRRQVVPNKYTTYWCSLNKGPELQEKHHIVGFHFRWESPQEFQHTHHLILFKCQAPPGEDPVAFFQPFARNSTGEECYFLSNHNGQLPTQYCTEVKYGYAIGNRMFFLPNETGIPFGESPDEYYLLQVHYDNPQLLSNLEYEIKLDMYYTDKLRPIDGGVLTMGHIAPGFPSVLVPPNTAEHSIYGHCGSECTDKILPEDGINIVATVLHTHNTGYRIRLRHFRGNVELPWINNDDNYNNGFQASRLLREEVKVLPGDHLVARCVYGTDSSNSSLLGGFSTRHEMCVIYLYYSNKLPAGSFCRSEIRSQEYLERYLGVSNVTWDQSQVEFVVTSPPSLAGLQVTDVADNYVDWTPERRRQLQMDHVTLPQQNECSATQFGDTSGSQTSPGRVYPVTNPVGVKEYVPPPRKDECRFRTPSIKGWGWGK